jgi:glycosyltransferase involved in cell wall biosynthesis
MSGPGDVAVVIPARNEAERIGATVVAAGGIAGVEVVVVVDDGSTDQTADLARAAGARVLRNPRRRGKGAALTCGVAQAEAPLLLFLDADLADSASAAASLVGPVRAGDAEMSIATLPPQAVAGGGHGFVVALAAGGIRRATGRVLVQPLSGQRCLSRRAFAAASPLAYGFGVEVGLTIDVLRGGLRVVEVPCELHHRVTGADWRGQWHRGRQFAHVATALARRR